MNFSHLRSVAVVGEPAMLGRSSVADKPAGLLRQPIWEAWVDPQADVFEQVVQRLDASWVRGLLDTLPAAQREVIALRYGLDCAPHTRAQIARTLGIGVKAVICREQAGMTHLQRLATEPVEQLAA
jgi:DNA-directed RNA polymerase specialized sigma24 family protein